MPSPFVNLILDFATETTLALVKTAVDAINAKIPAAPATEGKQDAGNASLSSLDTKLPDQGQALAAASVPVVLPASQAGGALALDASVTATRDRLPAAFGTGGGVKVDGSGTALPVSASALPLPTGAATEAKQDTGNTSLSTLAGVVSAGKALVTETSAAAILAKLSSDPSTATLQTSGNSSLSTLAGIVSAGKAAISAAQLPAALGITTASGSLSVAPASDALFDVKDRAARLLGALTGVNGSSVATGANPVPMQISSGSTLYTGATAALSLPIVFARSLSAVSATLAINGDVIKASSGSALWITITNTTGSSVYWQIFDLASGPPANGARAAASAPAITANNGSRAGDLIGPTLGLGCNTGILLVLSLSPTTYSAVGSTSCSYSIQYI